MRLSWLDIGINEQSGASYVHVAAKIEPSPICIAQIAPCICCDSVGDKDLGDRLAVRRFRSSAVPSVKFFL
ncbi:hypothetical protein A5740_27310 [Mycobacterium sp. GA-1841]|nr:hypothetical protein A5740_27310 [Mycobacterium sp. GA-1841]